ncbi:MAG: hypothetical protein ABJB33_03470 [Gemmatimonadota bacterium]
MANNRLGWALALLTLTAGCGSAAKRQATQDSLAQVELQARRDSLKQVKAGRDSVARIRYAACADSVRKALMRTPAGRAKLRVRVVEGQPRPENLAACGVMPESSAVASAVNSPTTTAAAPAATTPAARPPATAAAKPAAPTAEQQRVARADSVRQARERSRQDSLARVGERKRTDSIARVALDSARADSVTRARETEVLRETFSYSGASRDPFQSVVSSGNAGPDIADMVLVTVIADLRSARNSVAVLREKQGTRRWRVKVGDRVGTATVSLITQRDVTFSIQDFGFERQETLSLRKSTEDTP